MEIPTSGPGWKLDINWMETWILWGENGIGLRCNSMAGCETNTLWPGLDLRCNMNWSKECLDMYGGDAVHRWRWDLNLGIMMQVRKVHYDGETYIFIPWCVLDATWMELGRCSLGTWMEIRHHLDGGETRISGPVWRGDVTWIAMKCESSDLGGDNVLCGDGTIILGPGSSYGGT